MSEKEQAFWAKYAEKLLFLRVNEKFRPWYVKRAKQFVYGLKGRKLRDVDSAYLGSYFEELGRNGKLESWQILQSVFAVEILLKDVVELPWAAGFDWAGQKAACQEIGPNHASRFREGGLGIDFKGRNESTKLTGDSEKQLKRLQALVRTRGMAIRTEQTYLEWARRFGGFCGGTFPENGSEIPAFLEYLAVVRKVAPATQSQALNALVFLYKQVFGAELGDFGNYRRPARKQRLPVVLSRREVGELLDQMPAENWVGSMFSHQEAGR